jgi:ligand-binding sensor domain-containing protein
MAKYFKLILILVIFPKILSAQYDNIKFDHITVDDGLSNNFVRSIVQDNMGFMWFATEDGLNKFDGYTFTVYRNDPNDSTSLSENKVEVLQVDKNGIIWVGTNGGGLNAFNPQTEEFTRYNMAPDDLYGISNQFIYDMYADKSGQLWISVQGKGLYKFDPGTKKITHYPYNPNDPNTVSTNVGLTITSTVENSREIFWIGSWGGGLNRFDPENNEWTHYWHDPNNTYGLSENYLAKIYADNSGFLWITNGQSGLDKLDTKTGRFTNYRHDPENSNSISGNIVGEVWERDGILWIATMSGLNRLDIKKEEFKSYYHNPMDPESIGQNSTWRIYESRDGLLWIGGWAGIDMIDFEQKPFVTYQKEPGNPNSLSDNFTCAILETKQQDDDILWIGTKDGGLNKLNRQTGQFTHYQHNPTDPNSLSDNFIFGIAASSYRGKNELWLGTLSGLNRFDPQTGKFTHYRHNPDGRIHPSQRT